MLSFSKTKSAIHRRSGAHQYLREYFRGFAWLMFSCRHRSSPPTATFPAWTDVTSLATSRDAISPRLGFQWFGKWRILISSETDRDGWQYGKSFKSRNFNAESKQASFISFSTSPCDNACFSSTWLVHLFVALRGKRCRRRQWFREQYRVQGRVIMV